MTEYTQKEVNLLKDLVMRTLSGEIHWDVLELSDLIKMEGATDKTDERLIFVRGNKGTSNDISYTISRNINQTPTDNLGPCTTKEHWDKGDEELGLPVLAKFFDLLYSAISSMKSMAN